MNKQTRKIFYISVYFNHEKLTLGYMRQIKYKAVISVKIYRKKTVKDFVVDRDKINIYCSRVYSLRTQKLQQNQPSQILKKKKINIKTTRSLGTCFPSS